MQQDELKLIEEQIDTEFEIQVRRFCELTPIKDILEISLTNHETPNCKVRAITEGLYSWYKLTDDKLFCELAYYVTEYAKVFTNEITIDSVIELKEKLWKYSEKDFPYFSIEVQGRVKAMESELHDLITKLLKAKIVENLLADSNALTDFLEDSNTVLSTEVVELYLKKLRDKYYNSLNKDTFGFMFILDYNERVKDSDNPEFMRESAVKFAKTCIDILKQSGIEILGTKDFISDPKGSGYKAFHITTRTCEIQIVTRRMYNENNDPRKESSHVNYKNTFLNNELLKVITDVVYRSLKKELAPEVAAIITCSKDLDNIDALKCHPYDRQIIRKAFQRLTDRISEPANPFSSKHMTRTPNDEIPRSIDDLNEFEGITKLQEFKKSHTQFSSKNLL